MVRSYSADVKVQEILNELPSAGDGPLPKVGLIIGQFSRQRDLILHLMQTPIVDSKGKDSSATSDGVIGDSQQTVGQSVKTLNPEALLEKSLGIHARQARQMLTGGLDVLGMFVCCPTEEFKSTQSKYKQLLYAMFKVVSKFDFLLPKRDVPVERILMHLCSFTKKTSCRSYDITDPKHPGSSADLRFQKLLGDFVGLRTDFFIRTVLYVEERDMTHCLERQIISGLKPTIKSVWNAIPVVNGDMLDDHDNDDGNDDKNDKSKSMSLESFRVVHEGKPRKYVKDDDDDLEDEEEEEEEEDTSDVKVELLRNYSEAVDAPPSEASSVHCGAKIMANGTISCRAFMHVKSPVADGVKALKLDIVRSLLTRCELVCQDLLQGEEDQDVRAVYETPVRAFARLHGSDVLVCDYMFQDETKEDSMGRFTEVLGLRGLNEEDIDQLRESIPDAEDLEQAETILNGKDPMFPSVHVSTGHEENSWTNYLKPFFSIPFSVLVASVASLTATYWYLGQSVDREESS